jgi:plastocyanin
LAGTRLSAIFAVTGWYVTILEGQEKKGKRRRARKMDPTMKTFTFPTPGYYAYFCMYHGFDDSGNFMAGVVWVQ